MLVMSSQRFLDDEKVAQKKAELTEAQVKKIEIPVVKAYITDLDDIEMWIMVDKHHTLAAAKELNIDYDFVEVDDDISYYKDIENRNGEAICEAHFMDSNWYYINGDNEGQEVW